MEFKMTPKHYFIVFSAALVILLSMGTRHSFGLFQTPISEAFGIGLTAFSFSLALQNLLWGLSQPFIGAIADKYGTGRVIAVAGARVVEDLKLSLPTAELGDRHPRENAEVTARIRDIVGKLLAETD